MNQPSRTIYSSSLAHLFNELNFQLKFNSFVSWTKFNEIIVESSSELSSSWFGSLPALQKTQPIDMFYYTQWFKSQNKIGANSQLN